MIFSNLGKILSLCMIGAIAATIAGFSETPKNAVAPSVPAVAESTLPVQRTLTSADGRKLEVTILEKSVTAIKARRTSDAKEFELELTKLSTADQAFIKGLIAAPSETPVIAADGKRTVLLIDQDPAIQLVLEKAGFAVTVAPTERLNEDAVGNPGPPTQITTLGNMTDDQIQNFDLVWVGKNFGQRKTQERIAKLLPSYNGIVIWFRYWPIKKSELINKEPTGDNSYAKTKAYVKSDKNFICYSTTVKKYNPKMTTDEILEVHPEIADQIVAEINNITIARKKID